MKTRLFNMISLTARSVSRLGKPSAVGGVTFSQEKIAKFIHTGRQSLCQEKQRQIMPQQYFKDQKKEKKSFLDIVYKCSQQKLSDRGYVDFIAVALKYMKDYGVERDREVYKALINVLPKNRYIPRNKYQEMFMHFPSQQYAIIDVLVSMEDNHVLPDIEMEAMLLNIFGKHALVLKKYWRMRYWMPKFYHLNPWKAPVPLPTDPRELSKFAMWKLSTVDLQSYVEEFDTKDVPDAIDHTWIVSTRSPAQEALLSVHDVEKPLYVEGPFAVWIANQSVNYFVLKGDPIKREIVHVDTDDVSNIKIPYWEHREPGLPLTVHEQEDGAYFAMCATGTSSNDSLLSWIRCLEKKSPNLKDIPIVFKVTSFREDRPMLNQKKQKIDDVAPQESVESK